MSKTYQRAKHLTEFRYGYDRSRYWRKDTDKNGQITTTQYLGSVERITKSSEPGKVTWKRYLGKTAVVTITTDENLKQLNDAAGYKVEYTYHDHLGSLDVVTDHLGKVVQSMSFNAWGGRRNADTWDNYDIDAMMNNTGVVDLFKSTTTRGFTGHEMLDELGIIHMNGRIYDPRTARFLQADPIIQAAVHIQSYNRYSYTWNNPLNATNPSGYQVYWNEVQSGVRQVVAVVMSAVAAYFCGPAAAECSPGVYAAVMGAAAVAGAAINGAGGSGMLRAAITGSISGYFAGYSQTYLSEWYQRAAVMSVAGGITTTIQGGKFGHGFISAGIGAMSGAPWMPGGHVVIRIGVSAILGGTASRLTGGKFANGAATAAISAAVSEVLDRNNKQSNGYYWDDEAASALVMDGADAEDPTVKSILKAKGAQEEKSCEGGVLWCGVADGAWSGYGRVKVPGKLWGNTNQKIGHFECACRVPDANAEFGDRLVEKFDFYAPGEKMSDNNLYGIAEELVVSGDAWDGPRYVPHQYKTGFQIDTNSWWDTRIQYREF